MPNKNLPLIGGLLLVIILVGALIFYQKTHTASSVVTPQISDFERKKLAMENQPDWVKNLNVSVSTGNNPKNGLKTLTFKVTNLPPSTVNTIEYVAQYQTTNVGMKGAGSSSPVALDNATDFTRTFDLGTCSTKSCVRHEGIKDVDMELTLNTSAGDSFSWAKTLPL